MTDSATSRPSKFIHDDVSPRPRMAAVLSVVVGLIAFNLLPPAHSQTLSPEVELESACPPDLDGDRAIIGCRPLAGPEIYRRVDGVWVREQALGKADPSDPGVLRGAAVIQGRTAAVSGQIDGSAATGGAVYVFRRVGNGLEANAWRQEAKLIASDWEPFPVCDPLDRGNGFGDALAIDGNRLAVGARFDCESGPGGTEISGAVYVFRRKPDGTWIEEAKLVGSGVDTADQFGWSVSLSGTTLVAGAPFARARGDRIGSAYVFSRNGRRWTEDLPLPRSGTLTAEDFGISVAVDGTTILVGANRDDDLGDRSGSVYVYERTGDAWNEAGKILADDGRFADRFGTSVALEGHRALVGATGDDDGVPNSGSAYLFEQVSGGTWQQAGKLTAPDPQRKDEFGLAVSLSGSRAAIFAPRPPFTPGSTYIFALDAPAGGHSVTIDFEPGKPANRIDPTSQPRFRVAVLSDSGFDALQVDVNSVRLQPGSVVPAAQRVDDANSDGLADLVFIFDSASAALPCGESTVELTGQTAGGVPFSGTDTITNTSCP